MAFDLVIVGLLSTGTAILVLNQGWHWDDWILWTTLYNANLAYGLLSGPFVLFTVPVLGQALHHAKATGYDRSGMLVPKLSNSGLKQRIQHEQEEVSRPGPSDAAPASKGLFARGKGLAKTSAAGCYSRLEDGQGDPLAA